ncbi:MAG: hypothetical protein NZ914_14100 [Gemmatales bacterium]|nr:hypothetical protein [Gemmatales bacterium]
MGGALQRSAQGSLKPQREHRIPLAIHRWFAQGEGWAYHSRIDLRLAQRVAAKLLTQRAHLWAPLSSCTLHSSQPATDDNISNLNQVDYPGGSVATNLSSISEKAENSTNLPEGLNNSFNSALDARPPRTTPLGVDQVTANQLSCQDNTSKFPPYEQGTREIDGHRFAYLHRADIHCPDPRAQGRFPSVLVLALLDDLEEERVQDFLQYLQERLIHILPDHPGPNPHLEVLYQYELHTSPAQTLGLS